MVWEKEGDEIIQGKERKGGMMDDTRRFGYA